MASHVDVNELFLKCMTESVTEKLTARTVAAYITSPFEIYCNNFVSEAEKDEITEYQKLLFQRGNDHENRTKQCMLNFLIWSQYHLRDPRMVSN